MGYWTYSDGTWIELTDESNSDRAMVGVVSEEEELVMGPSMAKSDMGSFLEVGGVATAGGMLPVEADSPVGNEDGSDGGIELSSKSNRFVWTMGGATAWRGGRTLRLARMPKPLWTEVVDTWEAACGSEEDERGGADEDVEEKSISWETDETAHLTYAIASNILKYIQPTVATTINEGW